jgi:hypothetical protein
LTLSKAGYSLHGWSIKTNQYRQDKGKCADGAGKRTAWDTASLALSTEELHPIADAVREQI